MNEMRILRIILLFIGILLNCHIVWAECQYYKQLSLNADSIFLSQLSDNILSVDIEARVKVFQNRERDGKSKSLWRLLWNFKSLNNYNYIELSWNNTNYGDILDTRQAIVNIVEVKNGHHYIEKSVELEHGVNLSTGFNTILVEAEQTKYNVFVGEDELVYLGTFSNDSLMGACGLLTSVNSYVSSFVVDTDYDISKTLYTQNNKHSLKEKFNSSSSSLVEGFWNYLDRNNDPDWTRLGGRYQLALVQNGDDFDIIYIGGAEINKSYWKEGMIKGRLKSTIFQNHYDLEWYDSMFDLIDEDAHATIENSILTLDFPVYKTQIRFYKEEIK